MIDLRLFRSQGFTGSVAMNLVPMFAIVGFAIFTTQYLQSVLGMSRSPPRCGPWCPWRGPWLPRRSPGCRPARGPRVHRRGRVPHRRRRFAGLTQLHAHSPIWFILIGATVYAGGIVGVIRSATS